MVHKVFRKAAAEHYEWDFDELEGMREEELRRALARTKEEGDGEEEMG
jgi:hypothetical protein